MDLVIIEKVKNKVIFSHQMNDKKFCNKLLVKAMIIASQ